jgi:hypothetical protein
VVVYACHVTMAPHSLHILILCVVLAILLIGSNAAVLQPRQGAARADSAGSLKETRWNPPAYLRRDLDAVWVCKGRLLLIAETTDLWPFRITR